MTSSFPPDGLSASSASSLFPRVKRSTPSGIFTTRKILLLLLFVCCTSVTSASGLELGVDGGVESELDDSKGSGLSSVLSSRRIPSAPFHSFEGLLIESMFRSGFYSDVFIRVCRRDNVAFSGSGNRAAAKTKLHSTTNSDSVNSRLPVARKRRNVRHRKTENPKKGKCGLGTSILGNICLNISKLDQTSSEEETKYLVEQANEHREEIDDACNGRDPGCEPFPEIVHLSKVCSLRTDLNYLPSKTIIHVCRPSVSCCHLEKTCQVKSSETIKLIFEVSGEDRLMKGTVTVAFQNHTECECRLKCPAKCPVPYTNVKAPSCQCTCSGKARASCVQIQKGLRPLSDEQKECVERHDCRFPSCTKGLSYNITTGSCGPA